MSANASVIDFISKMDDGTVFSIRDIDAETNYDSIKTQISNACSKGLVVRVIRGIYYKPKTSGLTSKRIPFNMYDVVDTIARMNDWHIMPGGNACMNFVGLSIQVPSKYVYLSDGPYKKYSVDGMTIEFKHRSPKNLPRSVPLATLVQAIKSKGMDNIDSDSLTVISAFIKDNAIDIDDLGNISMWIKDVIRMAYDGSH